MPQQATPIPPMLRSRSSVLSGSSAPKPSPVLGAPVKARQGQTLQEVITQLGDIGYTVINSLGIQPFGPTSPDAYHTLDMGSGFGGDGRFQTVTLGGGEAPIFPGGKQFLQKLIPKQVSSQVKAVEATLLPPTAVKGRAADVKRPLVGAAQNERNIKGIIPDLNRALKKADNLGFESVSEARAAVRDYDDWVQRWDVANEPELVKLGNLYADLVENQKVIEAAGKAIPLYTRRSTWEYLKDYLRDQAPKALD